MSADDEPGHPTADALRASFIGASSLEKEATLRYFDQVWEHYRHLESARTQYVGFLFAVSVAVPGVVVGVLFSAEPHHVNDAAAFNVTAGTLLALAYLSLFVLGSLLRWAVVLNHYQQQQAALTNALLVAPLRRSYPPRSKPNAMRTSIVLVDSLLVIFVAATVWCAIRGAAVGLDGRRALLELGIIALAGLCFALSVRYHCQKTVWDAVFVKAARDARLAE